MCGRRVCIECLECPHLTETGSQADEGYNHGTDDVDQITLLSGDHKENSHPDDKDDKCWEKVDHVGPFLNGNTFAIADQFSVCIGKLLIFFNDLGF